MAAAAGPRWRRVLYPALPDDPGHALWKRDFLGASGLFGFVLKPCSKAAVAAMLDHLELFGMGCSWGGYESLLIPIHPETCRTAARRGASRACRCASMSGSRIRPT